MIERLSELQARLCKSRERLEALANEAAELQRQVRADVALIDSLQRLSRPPLGTALEAGSDVGAGRDAGSSGEDGHMVSEDAWEIALINEEGK